jgi:GNAT superfamily N-acetyltransferase
MTSKQPVQDFVIRPIGSVDRELWEPLWTGYQAFYDRVLSQKMIDFTWKRLKSGEIDGFLAIALTGESVGLIHYLVHPATSTMGGNCYIPDLFVLPSARRRGVGRTLIAAVVEAAKKNVAVVYWQTEEFNGTARRLYERIAKRSPFIRYQIDLSSPS